MLEQNQIQNDRIYDQICNFKWYLLPIPEQKDWKLMIQFAQNPAVLAAGVQDLNLDRFVNVSYIHT